VKIKPWTIERYLSRHAETRALDVAQSIQMAVQEPEGVLYKSALIVPVFDEEPQCLERLLARVQPKESGRRLLCVVANCPLNATPEQQARHCDWVTSVIQGSPIQLKLRPDGAWLLRGAWPKGDDAEFVLDVLLVDATATDFYWKEKDGVGRARKLAADIALSLFSLGLIQSPMLGSSDADAQLPPEYFDVLETESDAAGLLFPFEHQPCLDARLDEGMAQLEASFRYYVLGLHLAGSPYAYHSLGSSLAVSLPHYAAVRGFPQRQAGEDFYLLSKLAQLHVLQRVHCAAVRLLTRTSHRVPFGTGPRLCLWDSQSAEVVPQLLTYNPQVFCALRFVLARLTRWASTGEMDQEEIRQHVELGVHGALFAPTAPEGLTALLLEQARAIFVPIQPSLSQCPTARHRVRRVHEHFDALSTLQFIRRLSETHFPEMPSDEVLRVLGWVQEGALDARPCDVPSRIGLQRLQELERLLPDQAGLGADLGQLKVELPWDCERLGSLKERAG